MKKLVLLAILSDCATVPMARRELDEHAKDSKPPADAANVYVYRPGSVVGTAVKLKVFFDESWIGDLGPKTFAVLTVPPGEHKLVVRAHGSADQTLVVEPSRSYYVKATPTWGLGGANAHVEVITDESAARDDIRGCGLIASAAAERVRRIAARIAEIHVDPIEPGALIAEATRALAAMVAHPEPSQPRDLESTIAQIRASHPALDDQRIVAIATTSMMASLSSKPVQDALSPSRAIDGICGLVMKREGHEVVITRVVPDSPAAVARVKAGLELREVDGQSVRDRTLREVVQLLVGTPGTEVTLTLGKPGDSDRRLMLVRAPLEWGAVDCRVISGHVLYLRPWFLGPAAARRIRDQGRSVGAPAHLVILDLRDSPGDLVEGARDVADSFLASGSIFSVSGARVPGVNNTYSSTPGTSALEQARVVVLVNGNTAGSAEAIAAAIQDNRRGMVFGTKTAGNGKIYSMHKLGGMTLRIPIARLLRANGEPLDGHGVTPDILNDASAPKPSAAMSDVACSNVASPAAVSDDQLVRRAADLLMTSPDAR